MSLTPQSEFLDKLPSAIAAGISDYIRSGKTIGDFLCEELKDEAARNLSEHLAQIRKLDTELKQARNRGVSAAKWLGDQLVRSDDSSLVPDLPALVDFVPDLAQAATRAPTRVARDLIAATTASLGMGAVGQGQSADGGLGIGSLVDAVIPGAQKLVDDFFDSEFGSEAEIETTAAAATGAALLAQECGMKADVRTIGSVVDLGLQTAKIAYKIQKGELSGLDAAAELIEDRVAAQIGAYAGAAAARGLELAGGALGAFIQTHIPAATWAVPVGRTVGAMAGEVVRPIVDRGVRVVATWTVRQAKRILKKAPGTIMKTAGRVLSSLFG